MLCDTFGGVGGVGGGVHKKEGARAGRTGRGMRYNITSY